METNSPASSPRTYEYFGKQVNHDPASPFPSDRIPRLLKFESKLQLCLPPDSKHGIIARETMNDDDANAALAEWKLDASTEDAGGDR